VGDSSKLQHIAKCPEWTEEWCLVLSEGRAAPISAGQRKDPKHQQQYFKTLFAGDQSNGLYEDHVIRRGRTDTYSMYILILHGDLQLFVAPPVAVFGFAAHGLWRPDRRKRASKEAGGGKKEPVEMGMLETQHVLGRN